MNTGSLLMAFMLLAQAAMASASEMKLVQEERVNIINLKTFRINDESRVVLVYLPVDGDFKFRIHALENLKFKSSRMMNEPSITEGLLLGDFHRMTNAFATITGGYLTSFTPARPLGLVRLSGVDVSPYHTSWLVDTDVCISDNRLELLPSRTAVGEYENCIQAGPRFLELGTPKYTVERMLQISSAERRLVNSVADQSFVCKREGEILLGFAEELDMRRLSDILSDPQIGCNTAVRLSGHATAGLAIYDRIEGNSSMPLHNVISVHSRR